MIYIFMFIRIVTVGVTQSTVVVNIKECFFIFCVYDVVLYDDVISNNKCSGKNIK